MNLEAISQITFGEQFAVPASHSADRVPAGLPSGVNRAPQLAAALCTGYLAAHLQSLCIKEMQRYLDDPGLSILGTHLNLSLCTPPRPCDVIAVSGFVVGIGDREATFQVEARIGERVVADGTLRFMVVRRPALPRRLTAFASDDAGRTAVAA